MILTASAWYNRVLLQRISKQPCWTTNSAELFCLSLFLFAPVHVMDGIGTAIRSIRPVDLPGKVLVLGDLAICQLPLTQKPFLQKISHKLPVKVYPHRWIDRPVLRQIWAGPLSNPGGDGQATVLLCLWTVLNIGKPLWHKGLILIAMRLLWRTLVRNLSLHTRLLPLLHGHRGHTTVHSVHFYFFTARAPGSPLLIPAIKNVAFHEEIATF